MGCLVGKAWASNGLAGTALTSDALTGAAYTSESLVGSAELSEELRGVAYTSVGLKGRVGIICAISEDNYLFVEPTEVVWLTPDNDFSHDYSIFSNTDWDIS